MPDRILFQPDIPKLLADALENAKQDYARRAKEHLATFSDISRVANDAHVPTRLIRNIDETTAGGYIDHSAIKCVSEWCDMINTINNIQLYHRRGVRTRDEATSYTEALVHLIEYGRIQNVTRNAGVETPLARAAGLPSETVDLSPLNLIGSYSGELERAVREGARHCSFINKKAFISRTERALSESAIDINAEPSGPLPG